MRTAADCVICRGTDGDEELDRVEVWRDAGWRLTMARRGSTLGFAYLEPIRHIPYLADLDGEEAASFGAVIARASATLRDATGAKLVYAYVFGGVPHLHVHLAPNLPEGVLSTSLVSGPIEERPLPSGATQIVSLEHPDLPPEQHTVVIERVRELLRQ
jgi:diadenosine tetraphosphate (Ap4A) HIT family hydrolase